MHIIVFEDDLVDRLSPITLSRPAYTISCGSHQLIDWLGALEKPIQGIVRPHLAEMQRADYSEFTTSRPDADEAVLLINARLVPSVNAFRQLKKLVKEERQGVVSDDGEVAAVVLHRPEDYGADLLQQSTLKSFLESIRPPALESLPAELPLFRYPHDVVRYNMKILLENVNFRLENDNYTEIADGVFGKEGAVIGPHVVIDPSDGPILLEEGASIGPFSLLRGPAFVGRGSKLIEHAAIKDGVSVGHTAKIGGEVEASVVEAFTNKQHHGFLGHSYLGSWINLGAGTCNSDLKNTYGQVNMEYRSEKVPTGMQFVGCIMGDYSKTAINTGIFTGKVIGVCSMLYGFVTTNVPSYVNYARLFGQVTELPPEVMVATQKRMFQRRSVEQRPCDIQLLHDMYELTVRERQIVGEPLSL